MNVVLDFFQLLTSGVVCMKNEQEMTKVGCLKKLESISTFRNEVRDVEHIVGCNLTAIGR